ncbi:class I SAM-dependent methyltransferase [Primorskyibacter sp. S187A]|uniref:class I SAM-dependent methyltransferase n=1 Tax=Primorskyibacter sp. S187A TaxID=3415130 RepID=UPI003C7A43E6
MSDGAQDTTPLTLLRDWAVQDSFETFRDHMTGAMLFPRKASLRKWACLQAQSQFGGTGLYAEFGVWRGHGVNLFGKLLKKEDVTIWGFDSFEGLEEDWTGQSKGAQAGRFNLDGVLPDVRSNVQLVKGWVQDSVPQWLDSCPDMAASFLHFDLDTYTPTRFVLEAVRARLVPGTILLFDELYGYPGWRRHEYRALTETLPEDSYDFIAFSEQAVALRMTRALDA